MNCFISDILIIAEHYIGYLRYIGKIYLPDDLDSYDAAIDVTAEIFKTENDAFVIFRNYFDSMENKPENEEEFERRIKSYLYTIIQNNLISIFKLYDPVTFKIIRNLKLAVESGGYYTATLFTDRYVYIGEVDFNKGNCIDRDTLMNFLYSENISQKITLPELLKKIFFILNSNSEYISAISYCDIAGIYKNILASSYRIEIPNNDYEEKLHFKFLIEELKHRFFLKIKKYFIKKSISEKEQECIYNIINEVINSYLSGIRHDSIKNLVDRHFEGINGNNYHNKIEYLIGLLNRDILIETGYLKNDR